jgi:hypothetical protein
MNTKLKMKTPVLSYIYGVGPIVRERPFNLKWGGHGFFLKKYSDFGGGKKK